MSERLNVFKNGDWPSVSYTEIVETFGTILAEADDNDYQGDSVYLIRSGSRVGVLTFGWGSCSGCDSLEAALYPEETAQQQVNELQDDLERGIRWFDAITAARDWVLSEDAFSGSFLHDDLLERFRTEVSRV